MIATRPFNVYATKQKHNNLAIPEIDFERYIAPADQIAMNSVKKRNKSKQFDILSVEYSQRINSECC